MPCVSSILPWSGIVYVYVLCSHQNGCTSQKIEQIDDIRVHLYSLHDENGPQCKGIRNANRIALMNVSINYVETLCAMTTFALILICFCCKYNLKLNQKLPVLYVSKNITCFQFIGQIPNG